MFTFGKRSDGLRERRFDRADRRRDCDDHLARVDPGALSRLMKNRLKVLRAMRDAIKAHREALAEEAEA